MKGVEFNYMTSTVKYAYSLFVEFERFDNGSRLLLTFPYETKGLIYMQ